MFRGVWVKGVITGRGTKTTTGGDTYTGQWAKDKVRGGRRKEIMYYLFSKTLCLLRAKDKGWTRSVFATQITRLKYGSVEFTLTP